MKFDRILLPLDFSEYSEKSLEYALSLAETYGAKLTLLHAIVLHYEDVEEEAHLKQLEELIKLQEKNSYERLKLQNQKAGRRGVSVTTKVIRGVSAADAILEFIDDHPHDLVILGTHGRTGVERWLYGSVAEKVVRYSPIPVLTIHKSWDKPFMIQKVLAPVDFSEYSKKATEAALSLGRKFNARVTFLHVVEQTVHPAYYAATIDSLFIIDPHLLERSIRNLKEFTGGEAAGAEYVIKEGRAFKEIADFAEEQACDLILMSTRGLTGLEHLLIGSTTERVVRSATCPVLTVGREK
ncbi:MAG: universal stress protein [Calditrichaceae bacterium]|nr:universal stress protein [Calditrichia bacterium]NUQ40868.1 universal stress protein [Calditrichaceae bacterium]